MRKLVLVSSAVWLCLAPLVVAQDRGSGASSGSAAQTGTATYVGCLMREADFRKLNDKGSGGVLGTGLGVGNEFVLTEARPLSEEEARQRAEARAAKRAMPKGTAASGAARNFMLTGGLEKDMVTDIGRMVEVVGSIEGSNEPLPRFTVTLWHPVGDFCPENR